MHSQTLILSVDLHPLQIKLDVLTAGFLYLLRQALLCSMFKVPVSCFRMPGPEKPPNPSSRPPIPPTPDVVFAAGNHTRLLTASSVRIVTVCDGFRLGLFMLEVSGYDEIPSREQFHFDRTSKELVLMVLLKNFKKLYI